MARKKSASAKSGSGAAKASGTRKTGGAAKGKEPSRPGPPASKQPTAPETHESTLEALRESEQTYRTLVEQSLQGLIVLQDARIVLTNPASAEICGYTEEELVSLSPEQVTALVHPDDRGLVWKRVADRLAGEPAPPRYDYRLICKDGRVRWVEMSARRIQYGGRPAVQAVLVDVSGRRRAEERVEQSERFLQNVFDSIQDGITVRDRDLRLIQTNRWVEEMFASEMPLVGKPCYQVFQRRGFPCPWCPAIPAMETGESHSQVVPYPSAENPTGWLELTAFPLEDPDGNVVGAIEHVRDVTERRRAERELREEKERAQNYLDVADVILVAVDPNGRVAMINRKGCEVLGRSEDEVVGRDVFGLMVPEREREQSRAMVAKLKAGGEEAPYCHEGIVVARDGTERIIRWRHTKLLQDPAGDFVGMLSSGEDITERKRAEEESAKARALLAAAIEQTPAGIVIAEAPDVRIRVANSAALGIRGKASTPLIDIPAELHPKHWQLFYPDGSPYRGEDLPLSRAILRGETSVNVEVIMRRSDGSDRWVLVNAAPVRNDQGEVVAAVTVFPDITERKRADEILDFERRQLLSIFDSIDEGIYVADPETHEVLYVNRAMEKVFGDVAGQKCYRVLQGLDAPCPFCTNDQILGDNEGRACIWEHRNDVTGRWYRCIDRAIRWPDGRVVRYEMAIDVTERKRAEEALRESEQKFRGIAERSFDIIFMMDLDGHLTYVSPAVEAAFLYEPEEMVGRPFTDFVPESEAPRALRRLSETAAGVESGVVQAEGRRKDGSRISIEISSSPIFDGEHLVGIQGIIRDVTERNAAEEKLRRMEAQLAHVGRLSTMGELVAGIAHEVSQPLYSVLNFAKASRNVLAGDDEPNLDDLRDWSEQIAGAASRAGQIIARLRSFVRRIELQRSPADISEVVRESVELVAFETRRHRAAVQLELDNTLPPVQVDRVQIQQVLVNLLRNACEALDQIPAEIRRVIVRTARAGESVEVSVSDNGPGLPPKEDLNPFDAFVTSKPGGLGIGLAISRTIIEAHGSDLRADPAPEGGATFHFSLPISKGGR